MTQSVMLHHLLRTPSDLYFSLHSDEQLEKMMHTQGIETGSQADAWFDGMWNQLFDLSDEYGVKRELFEPIYIERDAVKAATVLRWETDTYILEHLKVYDETPLGVVFANIKIDFYNLKRLVMFGREMNIVATGFIDESLLSTYGADVKGLFHASRYYDTVETIDSESIEVVELSIIKQAMESYRMDGNSDDGLFAKMAFRVLELYELRARMKAIIFGLRDRQVVRVYE